MLSWSAETGWQFSYLGAFILLTGIAFIIWRNRVRRQSLCQRDDGWYVWVEWHGGERCASRRPAEPGGDWNGDGDGGDQAHSAASCSVLRASARIFRTISSSA